MAKRIDFDPTPYLRPPKLDVRQAIALSVALLSALPREATGGMKRTARAMRKATLAMNKAWSQRRRAAAAPRPASKAKADYRVDTAWAALKMRLDACAYLPSEAHPKAERAGEITKALFPEGLEFLKLPMDLEWAESNSLLGRLDEDEALGKDVVEIAGPEYLAEVRAAHIAYGQALGITKAHETTGDVAALREPLRELVGSIGDYLLQVVASVDREAPETIEAARHSLAPLDRVRQAAARRAAGKGGKAGAEEAEEAEEALPEVDPDAPIPDVPQ
ncbi:hypothetical protein BE04_30080 [Sorangium cellulosum]|uniref:Uncharacterized protein n=2 Tax=Sorangium cellulosum TaxID=56 RepID=A0A150Q5Z9_SORCE|nr:hypothetical protein [Sorangium cellulosum]AGP42382.1 hypothetical protein SCE1572_52490 [Sorangium cellulosum So0157-2]KYF63409.1 hypothetical protein BE04_30080 [Sorangium cellulosum]